MAAEGRPSTPPRCSSPPAASRSSTSSARRCRPRRRHRRRGADLPRRRPGLHELPGRRRADRDGRRRPARRRARGDARPAGGGGPPAEVHLHDPELPEPGGRDAVAARGAAGSWRSPRERELLVLEDNPYGLLRYEGEPLPTLRALDGGASSSTSARSRRSSRPACAWAGPSPRGRCWRSSNLGKQATDLCSSPVTQSFVAAYFAHGDWQDYVDGSASSTARRRDVMLDALAEHLPPEATLDPARRAACSCGRRCRTTSTRPTCWPGRCARNVAFVPGPRGLRRRPRRRRAAGELQRGRRGDDPRGRAAHRRGRPRAARAARTISGRRRWPTSSSCRRRRAQADSALRGGHDAGDGA